MNLQKFRAIAVGLSFVVTTAPTFAQGMMEFGGLHSGTPGVNPGGLGEAVKGLYSRGTGVPQSSAAPRRGPQLSSESANQYALRANQSYLNATRAAKAGKNDIALREYANAVSIRERIWGSEDPAIAEISRKQAEIYKHQGNLAEVENCYRKVLACDTRHWGQGAPQLTKTVETLASLCDQQGKNKDALAYYRLLYALKTKEGGPNCADTKKVRLRLVTLMTFAADFIGAEQLLKEGVTTEEANPTHDDAYLSQLYETYGALMRESGRPAEAAQMEEKAKASKTPAVKPEEAATTATTTTTTTTNPATPPAIVPPSPVPPPETAPPSPVGSPSVDTQTKPAATSP